MAARDRLSIPPLLGMPGWAWPALYVAAYVALDWASYIRAVPGLNITPWNPQQALAVGLLIWWRGGAWLVGAGLLAAELAVRGVPAQWMAAVAASAALTAVFAAMAQALRRTLDLSLPLGSRRDMLSFALVVTTGSLGAALLYVLIHAAGAAVAGSLPGAIARYWVGDAVGLVVALPLLLMAMTPAPRARLAAMLRSPTWWACAALTCGALWLVFGRGEQDYFKFFYVLVLPVVWAAVRFGVEGAALACVFTQLGLIAAAQLALPQDITVFELQALLTATAITALLLGALGDERARAEAELRASLRFSAAGQMAAALAHELSQPLTALNSYAQACNALVEAPDELDAQRRSLLMDTTRRLVAEAQRAGSVTRRLRDFFRSGATSLQLAAPEAVLHDALEAQREPARQAGVRLASDIEPGLPVLRFDPIQIAVVLRNLLANALDSASGPGTGGAVLLRASRADGRLLVEVIDSGPGLDAERMAHVFEAPPSAKPGGLGVGLSICRAIVEGHGGKLWAEPGTAGRFCFSLPIDDHEPGASSA